MVYALDFYNLSDKIGNFLLDGFKFGEPLTGNAELNFVRKNKGSVESIRVPPKEITLW